MVVYSTPKDHTMSIEFSSGDKLLNEFPNPFKFENVFMLLASALLLGGAIPVILTAKSLFGAHHEVAAFAALAVATILMGVSVKFLIQALSQLRFYLGRSFPKGLAGELAVTQAGVGVGTPEILEAMRHQAIEFPEPQGALNGVLYSVVKKLVTAPVEVQAAAVQHFHSLIGMAALFASMLVSYFMFVGSGHEGVASWLYLPMSGLSLLTPFMQQKRWDVDSKEAEESKAASGNGAVWKFAGLIVFSIMAPVVIPRTLPAYPIPSMWIAPAMLLVGSMISSLIYFLAVIAKLDAVTGTSVACEQTTIAMNCPPAQLWSEMGRRFQTEWTRNIPNRAYANVAPDVSAGERGTFGGFVVEESQPVPTSTLQFASWVEAIQSRHARLLLVLGAWGVVVSGACSATAIHFTGQFADMSRMEVSRAALIVMALSLVAVLSLRIGHLMWSRMQFKSRLFWVECSGAFQTSQLSVGNQFRGNALSNSTLTRIEDATLRVWVTDIVSVVFGKDGRRSIIAMASADSTAKSLADHLVAFAAEQSSIATPSSSRDLSKAQSIGALDMAVRQAVKAEGKLGELLSLNRAAQVGAAQRKTGRVKFFNQERGFGYIVDADRKEYFFNLNYVDGDLPEAGEQVSFIPGQSERGAVAKKIRGSFAVAH